MNSAREGKVSGCVSSLTVAIIYFLRSQDLSESEARKQTKESIDGLEILDMGSKHISSAFDDGRFNDFEDALQFHSAKGVDVIITRNKRDFARVAGKIEVLSPEEFVNKYKV